MAKYPQRPARSRASAYSIYGMVLGLSVLAVGLLAERFHWGLAHPTRPAYDTIPARPTSEWPPSRPRSFGPSLQVVAFAGHLKGIRALAGLTDPLLCEASGKHPRRPRYCKYQTDEVEVRVGYDRDHGELRSVAFTRRDHTQPLDWSDLASVIPWVCPLVSQTQAEATTLQFGEKYLVEPWTSRAGMTPERPVDGGRREIRVDPHPQCRVVLLEQVDRNYSELYVMSVRPGPKTMRPEKWTTTCTDGNRSSVPCSQ